MVGVKRYFQTEMCSARLGGNKMTIAHNSLPFDVRLRKPNSETIEAMEEIQSLKHDLNKRTYGSFAEILQEIDDKQKIN